jgi:hypothetical protein
MLKENANLKKAIKESLLNSKKQLGIDNSPPPDGWRVIKVSGDGSCGFHAIMKCLSFQENNSYKRISNNPSLRLTLENRKINFNEKAGFALRYYLARELEEIRNEIIFLQMMMKHNIDESQKKITHKRYQKLIDTYNLNDFFVNNEAGISESNIENPVSYLNAIIEKLENFKINQNTNEWLTQQILVIIVPILKKNIFIFFRGTWKQILYEKPCNPNNSIFLKFNGIHYDALIPSGKIFKNNFNNIPETNNFNYNFLKNIE